MRPAAVVLLVLALAGCARPAEESAPGPRPITVTRTGGIAGVDDKITVDTDGAWRHTGRNQDGSGTLSADQRARLTRMADDLLRSDEAGRLLRPTGCADVFTYSVTVGNADVRWEDCGRDSENPPLAQEIARSVLEFTS
jgi:hypothetical protein